MRENTTLENAFRGGVQPSGRFCGYRPDGHSNGKLQAVESHRIEPFFLNFWHFAVHGPWGHKEEYTKQFAEKTDPRGQQRNPIMASMLRSVDEVSAV